MTLLSIVIPAFNRPTELIFALERFAAQIDGKFEKLIEVIVVDDASPHDALEAVKDLASQHSFMDYKCWDTNVGLEHNLIRCTEFASGEYLWIFGDDDYLETDTALSQVMDLLSSDRFDMLVLNRTRRSADLSKTITLNWMGIPDTLQKFDGLRQFCLAYGFISVIGFISVNVFRRKLFTDVSPDPYFGTMYPQLGMMLEAFHDRPVALVGTPLICHRTQTQEEKKIALGDKASEADFMADANRRNALYFSHPYVKMLDHLLSKNAFNREDIVSIQENTVINGPLIQFLLNCVEESLSYKSAFTDEDWTRSLHFFSKLKLDQKQSKTLRTITKTMKQATQCDAAPGADRSLAKSAQNEGRKPLVETISAITPSFNQAEFLDECLHSIASQTHPAIEHFVYDPGSTDGSQDIARTFDSVTLFTEPDKGQSDAINKGFVRAKGDIIAWLNSDDVFAHQDVFATVVDRFNQPDQPDIVYGKGIFIAEDGSKLRDCYINKNPESLPWRFQQEDGILQPSLFMRRSVVEDIGPLNGGLHYCMDYEYWIRCVHAGKTFAYVDEDFALARYHSNNKTFGQRGKSYEEVCDMLVSHFGYANHVWLRRYAEYLSDGFDGVLSNATNKEVQSEAEVERHYVALMKAYNTSVPTYEMLSSKASERGYGDTLRELKHLSLSPSTPCEPVSLETATAPHKTCYTVGPRRWAFDRTWKQQQIDKTHRFFRDRIAERKHDVCVIVGNGPSLKKSDLSLLKDADTIISNNAFLDPDVFQHATYYTVVNYLVAEQSSHNINRLEGIPKVLPYWLSYCLNQGDDTYFADAVGHPEFSTDIFKNMSWRHTVTFYNLHLAYGLGYKRVAMIGFDHFYTQSKDVKEGDIVVSNDDDPNHFDSRYFKGKKWQAADVDMMEAMYRLADVAFRDDGREIVNATVGGALELFPRMTLKDAIDMKPVAGAVTKKIINHPTAVKPAMTNSQMPRSMQASVDETEVVAALLQNRKGPSHTLLDVGAHFGTSASYFDKLDWSIHCFEPDVDNHKKLQEKLGKRPNVRLDRRALSHQEAIDVPFFTSEESTGVSGLNSFTESHSESDKVEVTTIENIAKERKLSHVDFLKIDVEGFDFNVLKGVPWDNLKPDVIEAEFEDSKTIRLGHGYRDTCDYLIEKGYTVYLSVWHPIVRYGIPHDWRELVPYPSDQDYSAEWGNIVAFRNDPGLPALQSAFFDQMHYRNGAGPKVHTTQKPGTNGTGTSPNVPGTAAAQAATAPTKPVSTPAPSNGAKNTGAAKMAVATPSTPRTGLPAPAPRRAASLPLYTRFASWASKGHPVIFAVGKFTMWVLRVLRRYPLLVVLALLAVGGLVAGFFTPQLEAYRYSLGTILGGGVLATAVTLFSSYQIHLLKRTNMDQRAGDQRFRSVTEARLEQARRTSEKLAKVTDGHIQELTGSVSSTVASVAKLEKELAHTVPQRIHSLERTNQVRETKTNNDIQNLTRSISTSAASLARMEKELADVLPQRVRKLEEANAVRDTKTNSDIQDLTRSISTSAASVTRMERELTDVLPQRLHKLEKDVANVEALRTSLDAVMAETQQLKNDYSKFYKLEKGFELRLDGMSETLATCQSLIEKLSTSAGDSSRRLSTVEAIAQQRTTPGYVRFNRQLDAETLSHFETHWCRELSVNMKRNALTYFVDRVVLLEDRLHGRLATETQDILLRTMVARSVKRPDVSILEVGTLFGIGTGVMYDALKPHFKQVHFTLLDPLDGYYSAGTDDIMTGQPVTLDILKQNLEAVGMAEDEYDIVQDFSLEERAIQHVGKREYDVVILDGDHSYAGLKGDFENYSSFVRLGGFLIFDDYGTEDWPDIKAFVDAEVEPCDWLARVGTQSRTAVYKVTRVRSQRAVN